MPQTPQEVYDAILDVRGWWSQRIDGDTDRLGEFVYTVPGVHRTHAQITELVPEQRVVWHVLDGWLVFAAEEDEWAGTDIRFDIEKTDAGSRLTFTHVGLAPAMQCYESCSMGWATYALASLRELITTGTDRPSPPRPSRASARASVSRRSPKALRRGRGGRSRPWSVPAGGQTEGAPSAGWFAPDGIVLLTRGSSSCPPLITNVPVAPRQAALITCPSGTAMSSAPGSMRQRIRTAIAELVAVQLDGGGLGGRGLGVAPAQEPHRPVGSGQLDHAAPRLRCGAAPSSATTPCATPRASRTGRRPGTRRRRGGRR